MVNLRRFWGRSSAGRASRSQCEGQEFDPPRLHQVFTYENRPSGRFFLGSKFPRFPAISLLACAKNVPSVPGTLASSCSRGIEAAIGAHCTRSHGRLSLLCDQRDARAARHGRTGRPGCTSRSLAAKVGRGHQRMLSDGKSKNSSRRASDTQRTGQPAGKWPSTSIAADGLGIGWMAAVSSS